MFTKKKNFWNGPGENRATKNEKKRKKNEDEFPFILLYMPSGRPYLIPSAANIVANYAQDAFRYGTETAAPYAKRIAGYAFGERALGYALQNKAFQAAGIYTKPYTQRYRGGYTNPYRHENYRYQQAHTRYINYQQLGYNYQNFKKRNRYRGKRGYYKQINYYI